MPADKSEPGATDPAETPDAPVDEAAEAVEEPPLNRAERRARGKGRPQAQPSFRGKAVGAHGPAHTARMWSNRRSGG
jgi:hypothetical protein